MSGRLGRIGVWAAGVLLTPALLFAFRDLWAVVLLLFAFLLPQVLQRVPRRLPSWSWPLLGLVAYGLVSLFWAGSERAATDAPYHLILALVFAGLFSVRPQPAAPLALGTFAAIATVSVELVFGTPLRDLLPPDQGEARDAVAAGRGLALGLFLLPGAALYAYRNRGWAAGRGGIIVAGLGAATSPIVATGVSLLAGLAAMAATALRPAAGLRAALLLAGLMLVLPFAFGLLPPPDEIGAPALPQSAEHRLVIWSAVFDAWLHGDVLFGVGARGSEALGDVAGTIALSDGVVVPVVSVHPHNTVLQVLYEYGLLGYGLVLMAFCLGARRLLSSVLTKDVAAATAALIGISAVVLSVEADIWNIYTLTAIAFGALMIRWAEAGA